VRILSTHAVSTVKVKQNPFLIVVNPALNAVYVVSSPGGQGADTAFVTINESRM
jgi:hypothetical protein